MSTPTLLLIDVGNSRIKYWFHHADTHPLAPDSELSALAHSGNLPTDELRTLWQYDTQRYGAPAEIRISHVAAQDFYAQIVALCAQLWPDAPLRRILPRVQHPHLNLGYDATQMGSDRYAQILGAQRICHTHDHLIISAGTALTVDGVKAGGTHIGGIISAGLRLMRTVLHRYTAQLPLNGGEISLHRAPNNTRDALASGVMLSASGAVTQFIAQYELTGASSANTAHLLFCGGDALELMRHCQQTSELAALPMHHAPALCLLGLLEMSEI